MFVLKVQRPQETDAMYILFSNIFLAQHLLIYYTSVEVQQFLIRCNKIVLFEKKNVGIIYQPSADLLSKYQGISHLLKSTWE